MSGGGGSSSSKQIIVDYAMSLHYAICSGPVDSIDGIYVQDKFVSLAGISSNTRAAVSQTGLFGGSGQNGGIAGYIDFMMGGPDQLAPTSLTQRLGLTPTTCPGFRGITSMLFCDGFNARGDRFNGFYWGSNYPTIPPVDAVVTRYPIGPNGDKMAGPNGVANPAHIIYECMTNRSWGMGCPVGLIDIESFQTAAESLRNEAFWLSMMWARSDTLENFIGEVIDHIQASLGPDPRTGKWKLRLLRNDYDPDNLFVIHPGNAIMTNMQRKLWGETANEVTVTWTNPETEQEEALTYHDDANIAAQGQVVTTTRNYYGVRTAELGSRLAMRDLRQSASPLLACDVEINRAADEGTSIGAWALKPGDVVELRWPEYGVGSCIMRVGDIDYGAPGSTKIRTSLLEDIFGLGSAIFTDLYKPTPGEPPPVYPPPRPGTDPVPPVVEPLPPTPQPPEWVDSSEPPRALDYSWTGTTPYFMLARQYGDNGMNVFPYPSVGTFALASQNSKDTSSIGRYGEIADVTGNKTFELQVLTQNMLRGLLAAPLEHASRSTIPALVGVTGAGSPQAGMYVLVHDVANPELHEIAAIESVAEDTNEIVLRRGVIDTTPREWPAGTAVWVFDGDANTIYDPTLHADGEDVKYKFAPVTSQGALDPNNAPVVEFEATDRPHLPYRPARFAIMVDGEETIFGPVAPMPGDGLDITWARRNRVTETGQLLAWTDPDVTPENGQTTRIVVENGQGQQKVVVDGLTGTSYSLTPAEISSVGGHGDMTVKLYAVRDGLTSFMAAERTISRENFKGYGFDYGYDYGGEQ